MVMATHSHLHTPSRDLSQFSSSSSPRLTRSRFSKLRYISTLPGFQVFHSSSPLKFHESSIRRRGGRLRRRNVRFRVFNEDSVDIPILDDWGDSAVTNAYIMSSSDGETSDSEFMVTPVSDMDLPTTSVSNNDAVSLAAHRFGMVGRGHKRHRIRYGVFLNIGLIIFLTVLLMYVDWCAWRIVRLPLEPFHLTRPFVLSAILASCAGYVCVPLLHGLKMYQILRKEGPARHRHSVKKRTPTMGGLFFVPVGVIVARFIAGFSSAEVSGAAAATLAFGAIGLLDDVLSLIKNHNNGLSARMKLLLEVAVGVCFSFWLNTRSVSSPYGMYTFL